jgi:hypothetical protein
MKAEQLLAFHQFNFHQSRYQSAKRIYLPYKHIKVTVKDINISIIEKSIEQFAVRDLHLWQLQIPHAQPHLI